MPNDSSFVRLPEFSADRVTVYFEGKPIEGCPGDSVAAILLANGYRITRKTSISGANRGPFCMMGACFECLVEIDGVPNQQACMVQVRENMQVRRMDGARKVSNPKT